MLTYLLIVGSALAIVLALIPPVRRAARKLGFVDEPSARKVHTTPLPRLGGVAIYIGCIGTLLIFDQFYLAQLVSIVLASTFVSFLASGMTIGG